MSALTVPEVARLLRVNCDTVRRWVRTGLLPDRRIPGARKILIWQCDLERLLQTEFTQAA